MKQFQTLRVTTVQAIYLSAEDSKAWHAADAPTRWHLIGEYAQHLADKNDKHVVIIDSEGRVIDWHNCPSFTKAAKKL